MRNPVRKDRIKNLYNSRLRLLALCIKSATGIFGSASILSEAHPYISLSILAIGGISNEIVQYLETESNI